MRLMDGQRLYIHRWRKLNGIMKISDQSAFKTIHELYTCRYLKDEQHFLEQVDHPYCIEACYVGAIAAVILLHILPVWLI